MSRSGGDIVRRRAKSDNYSTPISAIEALLDREKFVGNVFEPAVGEGNIAKVVSDRGFYVDTADIRDKDSVWEDVDFPSQDFITGPILSKEYDNVITNPPFSLALEFAERGLEVARHKLALLLRIQFLEGQKRKSFLESSPLSKVYVFSKRISMYPEGEENKGGGTQAFCWFVWDHYYEGEPVVRWI